MRYFIWLLSSLLACGLWAQDQQQEHLLRERSIALETLISRLEQNYAHSSNGSGNKIMRTRFGDTNSLEVTFQRSNKVLIAVEDFVQALVSSGFSLNGQRLSSSDIHRFSLPVLNGKELSEEDLRDHPSFSESYSYSKGWGLKFQAQGDLKLFLGNPRRIFLVPSASMKLEGAYENYADHSLGTSTTIDYQHTVGLGIGASLDGEPNHFALLIPLFAFNHHELRQQTNKDIEALQEKSLTPQMTTQGVGLQLLLIKDHHLFKLQGHYTLDQVTDSNNYTDQEEFSADMLQSLQSGNNPLSYTVQSGENYDILLEDVAFELGYQRQVDLFQGPTLFLGLNLSYQNKTRTTQVQRDRALKVEGSQKRFFIGTSVAINLGSPSQKKLR